MVDVARHAGVSLKTVSRVINDAPHVQQALIDKVLAARPPSWASGRTDWPARCGRASRRPPSGCSSRRSRTRSTRPIADVAAEVARAHDTLLITASSEEDPEREQRLLRDLCSRRVDGLLVVPAGDDHSFLRAEVEMGIPVVFLDRPATGLLADTVLLDNRGGARAAVQRLLGAGHRRIGDAARLDWRLHHARAAFRRAGGPRPSRSCPGRHELVRDGVRDPISAAMATAEMLDRMDPPTAFFTLNNRITVGAVQELWRRGSDAALVGFDDFELSHLMPRPLTVVGYDVRKFARTAAELLFERVSRGQTGLVPWCCPPNSLNAGSVWPRRRPGGRTNHSAKAVSTPASVVVAK